MQGGAERLAALLDDAERRGFSGLNITYPSKQAVIPLLHELAPEARALHSVNTVLFRNGRRIGHNTDWWGFAESFRRDMSDVNTENVVLVGAGGAGAAVGYAMLKLGSRTLTVHDMDGTRAAALVERMSELFPDRSITGMPRSCRRACERQRPGACDTDGHAEISGHSGARRTPCARRCGCRKSSMCRC